MILVSRILPNIWLPNIPLSSLLACQFSEYRCIFTRFSENENPAKIFCSLSYSFLDWLMVKRDSRKQKTAAFVTRLNEMIWMDHDIGPGKTNLRNYGCFSERIVMSHNSGWAQAELRDGDDGVGRADGVLAVAVRCVVDPVTSYTRLLFSWSKYSTAGFVLIKPLTRQPNKRPTLP